MNERDFWLYIREALLLLIDVIERKFDITPRTSQLRRNR